MLSYKIPFNRILTLKLCSQHGYRIDRPDLNVNRGDLFSQTTYVVAAQNVTLLVGVWSVGIYFLILRSGQYMILRLRLLAKTIKDVLLK